MLSTVVLVLWRYLEHLRCRMHLSFEKNHFTQFICWKIARGIVTGLTCSMLAYCALKYPLQYAPADAAGAYFH